MSFLLADNAIVTTNMFTILYRRCLVTGVVAGTLLAAYLVTETAHA